jgi:hypothetical protein
MGLAPSIFEDEDDDEGRGRENRGGKRPHNRQDTVQKGPRPKGAAEDH